MVEGAEQEQGRGIEGIAHLFLSGHPANQSRPVRGRPGGAAGAPDDIAPSPPPPRGPGGEEDKTKQDSPSPEMSTRLRNPRRRLGAVAVIAGHLREGRQWAVQFARQWAARVEPVGLLFLEPERAWLSLYEPGPEATDVGPAVADGGEPVRDLAAALEQLGERCDTLLVAPGADLMAEAQELIDRCRHVVVATTAGSEEMVGAYQALKCLGEAVWDGAEVALYVCQIADEQEARRIHRKIAETAWEFLGMELGWAGWSHGGEAVERRRLGACRDGEAALAMVVETLSNGSASAGPRAVHEETAQEDSFSEFLQNTPGDLPYTLADSGVNCKQEDTATPASSGQAAADPDLAERQVPIPSVRAVKAASTESPGATINDVAAGESTSNKPVRDATQESKGMRREKDAGDAPARDASKGSRDMTDVVGESHDDNAGPAVREKHSPLASCWRKPQSDPVGPCEVREAVRLRRWPGDDEELTHALAGQVGSWLTDVPDALLLPAQLPGTGSQRLQVAVDGGGRLWVAGASLREGSQLLTEALAARVWVLENLGQLQHGWRQVRIDRTQPVGLVLAVGSGLERLQRACSQLAEIPVKIRQVHLVSGSGGPEALVL